MKKILFVFAIAILFASCDGITADEIARLPISQLSNDSISIEEVTVDLKKGETLYLWTEMDLEYDDDLKLIYTIEVWSDTSRTGGFRLNPLETKVRVGEVRTSLGNHTNWSFSGQMKELEIYDTGSYTFKVALNSSGNPSLELNKAILVLKKKGIEE